MASKQKDNLKQAQAKLLKIREDLQGNFAERERVISFLMAMVLAKKNVLMIGPPGTAKSALAEAVCCALGGGEYFRQLLTKYSTPDEVFGPFSISGLKSDQYRRVRN